MCAAAISATTICAPRALVPTPPVERPEVLEQHLGGEVVAVAVHRPDDHGERLRAVGREDGRGRRSPPEPRAPGDRRSAGDERVAESPCREQRRRERRPAPRAVDDEGREGRRLAADEVRLPPGAAAPPIERGLVSADPAGDARDAGRAERGSQVADVGGRERGVAVAAEEEVAFPDRADALPRAEHAGREPVAGAETGQRGPRDGELLVRRRMDRDVLRCARRARRPCACRRRAPRSSRARRTESAGSSGDGTRGLPTRPAASRRPWPRSPPCRARAGVARP